MGIFDKQTYISRREFGQKLERDKTPVRGPGGKLLTSQEKKDLLEKFCPKRIFGPLYIKKDIFDREMKKFKEKGGKLFIPNVPPKFERFGAERGVSFLESFAVPAKTAPPKPAPQKVPPSQISPKGPSAGGVSSKSSSFGGVPLLSSRGAGGIFEKKKYIPLEVLKRAVIGVAKKTPSVFRGTGGKIMTEEGVMKILDKLFPKGKGEEKEYISKREFETKVKKLEAGGILEIPAGPERIEAGGMIKFLKKSVIPPKSPFKGKSVLPKK